ncbi:helix-turn-helix domain-containing protein [Thermomonospora cellulosilytica]|uniref:Transcriptional regulator with XRE-family HTH domain n=1 Tax=Thermomonospora cellulosilytica TaxID=1411118 RepID=A0A7W3MUA3_9ACTN|nr:helix-turn-helix transcriptional regulator [Thermomonospora cellulosilytica]MBA9002037.1 transcriptional regulator with XRE-family HTH domain [Thermomonospora cellulosilytica]
MDYKVNEIAAAAVRRHRERLGMSQTELAKRMAELDLSWHQMTVARTESGERPLRLDEALALANIFQIPLDSLMRPVDENIQREYEAILRMVHHIEEKANAVEEKIAASHARLERTRREYEKVKMQAEEMTRRAAQALGAAEAEFDHLRGEYQDHVIMIQRHLSLLEDLRERYPEIAAEGDGLEDAMDRRRRRVRKLGLR